MKYFTTIAFIVYVLAALILATQAHAECTITRADLQAFNTVTNKSFPQKLRPFTGLEDFKKNGGMCVAFASYKLNAVRSAGCAAEFVTGHSTDTGTGHVIVYAHVMDGDYYMDNRINKVTVLPHFFEADHE